MNTASDKTATSGTVFKSLETLAEKLFDEDIVAAATLLEKVNETEAADILSRLSRQKAVQALEHLQISYAANVLAAMDEAACLKISEAMDTQLLGSLLLHLPDERRLRIVDGSPKERRQELGEYLSYPEGSVGRYMSRDFLAFDKDLTAGEVIERIRSLSKLKRFPASYVYVVDGEKHLIGVLNARDLLLAQTDSRLESVMVTNIFSFHCFSDEEEAAIELGKRRYFAAPVVDSENHILGIVKAERMIQGVRDEMTKDLQTLFGAGKDERPFSTLWTSIKTRLPWLHVNLATAFLAAGVVALFEDVIARITVLAVFLPVVAGQGGNAGAQSMAVVMRGLVMREVPPHRVKELILKEGKLGAINGAVTGVVTALLAWTLYGNPMLGVVIGLGMLINLALAGLAGAAVPIGMKRYGLDPAQCSSIVLTTITDVCGFFAFLGLAMVFQQWLV